MTSLHAEIRTQQGSSHAGRLRRKNRVPAIVYGLKGKKNLDLSLCHNEIFELLRERRNHNKMLSLHINGPKPMVEKVIIKAVQRHPMTRFVVHADFLRVDLKKAIVVTVPIAFLNEDTAPGVRVGGIINHVANQVEIQCLPHNIPSSIAVDLAHLKLNESIHLSDIVVPEGLELTLLKQGDQNPAIATIHMPVEKEDVALAPEENDDENDDEQTKDK